jgi:hypothetical protein
MLLLRRLCIASVTLGAVSVSALAVDIPSTASVGPVPGTPGEGLNGRYWQLAPKTIGETPTALKDVGFPIINSTPPTATFVSTTVNYTGDDLTMFGTWLGSDAASLVGGDPAVNNMDDGMLRLNGFYAVSAPGTLDFRISSDDGSVLSIGGVTVIDNDGSHGAPGPSPNGSATFTEAGLYPVEITFYNGDWTDPANPASHGGANIAWRLGSDDNAPLVATSSLHLVPEPTGVALACVAGLGLLMWIVGRRK